MLKLRKPTRRTVHIAWLIISAVVAIVAVRGATPPVTIFVFFVVWLLGYWIIVRAPR
jgi:hypothetical protein